MPVEEVSFSEAIETIEWLAGFLGKEWTQSAIQQREVRLASFPYWRPERIDANPLADFFAVYEANRPTLTERRFLATPLFGTLLTHASNVRKVFLSVPRPTGESLRELLKNGHYAEGFLYQCSIASHYLRDGYGIASFSVGGPDEGDIVITDGGARVELQCKSIGEGAGRRIPRPAFNLLALSALNRLHSFSGIALIEVTCNTRLEITDIDALVSSMADLVADPRRADRPMSGYSIRVEPRYTPFEDQEVVAFLERDPKDPFRPWHLAFRGDLDGEKRKPITLVLLARSAKRDHVTQGVLKRAREAAGQLTGLDPGVVYVHIPDVLPSEVMASSGNFVSWLSALLRHPHSARVNAVVFTSETRERHGAYDAHPLMNPRAARPLPAGFRLVGARRLSNSDRVGHG